MTALILVIFYNPDPLRPYRDLFSTIHRIAGICLIILPILAMFRARSEYKVHLYNIKSAWLWSLNDLKWLALMGLAAASKRIVLPEQGKFNAAEKVNFMLVMVACPVFIVTGVMIWLHDIGWVAWLVHVSVALLVTPTMLGHIFMATINPDTRTGLKGMISGYVDRQWAKHHYGLWYREHFEKHLRGDKVFSEMIQPPDHHVYIHCPACTQNLSVSWSWLLQKVFSSKSLFCPNCGASFPAITAVTDEEQLQSIKREFEKKENDGHSAA